MTGSFHESVAFGMREVLDGPERVRSVVSGELDLAVAEMLGSRLRLLRKAGCDVRLDLAELDFIDSSGLRGLIVALDESRSDGWRLDIDPEVSEAVRRTVEIARAVLVSLAGWRLALGRSLLWASLWRRGADDLLQPDDAG